MDRRDKEPEYEQLRLPILLPEPTPPPAPIHGASAPEE